MKQKKLHVNKFNLKKTAYVALFFIMLILVWFLFAVTVFKDSKALPPPTEVFLMLIKFMRTGKFYKAIFFSLTRSLASFSSAFLVGALIALIASYKEGGSYFISPLITILRSVPTLGITFILLMFFKGGGTAIIVAGLVTLPLTFSGFNAALKSRDKKLYEMARIYKFSRVNTFTKLFLPSSATHLLETVRSGLGLNLKVVIAAEIISIPRLSIGSGMHGAYTAGDFCSLFAWVITAVIIVFLLEWALKALEQALTPYKGRSGKL